MEVETSNSGYESISFDRFDDNKVDEVGKCPGESLLYSPKERYLSEDWIPSVPHLARRLETLSSQTTHSSEDGAAGASPDCKSTTTSLADSIKTMERIIRGDELEEGEDTSRRIENAHTNTLDADFQNENLLKPIPDPDINERWLERLRRRKNTGPGIRPPMADMLAQARKRADGEQADFKKANQDKTNLARVDDQPRRIRRPRTILPIVIGEQTFDANPDSGSEENIMTSELVTRLGLDVERGEEHQREFLVANGRMVKALGRVQAMCTFAKDRGVAVLASFYVLRTLVADIIMGMEFLDTTETFTKHRFRLDKKAVPQHGICQVSAVNNPRRRLKCTANGKSELANADTGAEMDLISLKYARLRGLKSEKLEHGRYQVQLADGSTTHLAGKVSLELKMRKNRSHLVSKGSKNSYYTESMTKDFYILEGLTCSLLLGEETLEDLNAFEGYRENLVLDSSQEGCLDRAEICTILWFDTIETYISNGTKAPPPLSDEIADTPTDKPLSQRAIQRVKNLFSPKRSTIPSVEDGVELFPSFESRLKERDARESYRREVERVAIRKMPPGSEKVKRANEEQEKQKEYEQDNQRLLQARSQARAGDARAGSLHGVTTHVHFTEVTEAAISDPEGTYNA